MRLPSVRDPRLHLAATITSIQILGQVALGWELSIAQILVCLLTCAVLEVGIVFWESRVFAWPASALLTGNGVALVLRVNGTEHGDWWSLHGWYIFAATSAFALVSKHVIRFQGRPVVNPSNLGLVVCFALLGTGVVNPLDFWWGPLSAGMVGVYAILAAGAFAVTRRLRLLGMSAAFWVVFAAGVGVLSTGGHCITARWSVDPVCGADFWWILVTSPEVLIFMLFMITDPMTSPREPRPRLMFGAAVGFTSALLLAPWQSEFGAKVGVLAGLVLVCAIRPLLALARQRWASEKPLVASTWRARSVFGVAAMVMGVVALHGAGWRAQDAPSLADALTVNQSVLTDRPDVEIPAGAVPPVAVSEEVRSVINNEAQAQADHMAHDLVANLMIEARALREADLKLAATACAGTRLQGVRQALAEGAAAPSTYEFSDMTVVMVRDPADEQAVPRFGIRAAGTRTESGRSGVPLDRVFVLQEVADVWLLTDELNPSGV